MSSIIQRTTVIFLLKSFRQSSFQRHHLISQATQVLALKNRVLSSHLDDTPVSGCSPLELLEQGKYIAGSESFELVQPYMEYVVEVIYSCFCRKV